MTNEEYNDILSAFNLAVSHLHEKCFDDIFCKPIFNHPVELDIIRHDLNSFRSSIQSDVISFIRNANIQKSGIGNTNLFMLPKDEYSYRKISWIDPVDLVKYLTLSIILFSDIEKARIPKDLHIVHSHRKSDIGTELFDKDFGYNSFRQASTKLTREREGKWKIVTDIAHFFDRIGNHPLENNLTDIGCKSSYVKLLTEILFYWSGDRRSYGIPVGSDASRIISEAALIGIDNALFKKGITFIRYVDDYRIFADSRAEAYEYVRILSELLHNEGLYLNDRKTHIFMIADDQKSDNDQVIEINKQSHAPIDFNEKIEIRRTFSVSGRSRLSKYYKSPGISTLQRLQEIDIDTQINNISKHQGAEQEEMIRDAIKYFFYVKQENTIITKIINIKITSLFYIADACIKESSKLNDDKKLLLKNDILDAAHWESCGYPFQIPLLRLTSNTDYADPRLISKIVENHTVSDSTAFFREAISIAFQQLDRTSMRTLATTIYNQSQFPVKRVILNSLKQFAKMSKDEKRPLLKNMAIGFGRDYFCHYIHNL